MPDSGALRVRRARAHKAGDHSLCKRCAVVRSEAAPPPVISSVPRLPAGPTLDPLAELRELAVQLARAYRADPGNALLARELRMTLQVLMPQKGGNVDDELEDLFAELRT